jgi:hypothetical protein
VALSLGAVCGCDALGNPPRRWRTAEAEVRLGPELALVTRSETVPAEAVGSLLARARGKPHPVERPRRGGFAALVSVRLVPSGRAFGVVTPLLTTLEDDEGHAETRRWNAPPRTAEPTALFALDFVPSRARTVLAR